MSDPFPTDSTYIAPFSITDRAGEPITPTSVKYALSERRGGEPLLTKTDADSAVGIEPDGEAGVVEVELAPDEVPVGVVFEELRVASGGATLVVEQRAVTFREVTTSP